MSNLGGERRVELFILPSILNNYILEGTLHKISEKYDHCTTASLPPFLAFKLRREVRELVPAYLLDDDHVPPYYAESRKVLRFVYEHPDEEFRALLKKLFGDSEKPSEVPLVKVRSVKVAARYLLTDLIIRGLHRLYNRLRERDLEDKLLLISSGPLDKLASDMHEGARAYQLLKKKVTFETEGEMMIQHIVIPRIVRDLIADTFMFIDFSTFLAYCIITRYEQHFSPSTRIMCHDAVEEFEELVVGWFSNASNDLDTKPSITVKERETTQPTNILKFSYIEESGRFLQAHLRDKEGKTYIWTPKWSEIRQLYEQAILFELTHYGLTNEIKKFRRHSRRIYSLLRKFCRRR